MKISLSPGIEWLVISLVMLGFAAIVLYGGYHYALADEGNVRVAATTYFAAP